jgi:predicted dehydrogenase
MKQVVQYVRSRRLEVVEAPRSRCASGSVLVRNAASLISAGTERSDIDFAQKSLVDKARSRPDLVRQVVEQVKKDGLLPTLEAARERLDKHIRLGYSCAGVVEEVGAGVEGFSVGDHVACAGQGYASHADIVVVPKNLVVRIPDGVSFDDAAYVTLGAIAVQGVRVADVRLGDNVAVIGLGLLGQLSVQILRTGGCRVIGIDLDPAKVRHALELGADAAVVRTDDVLAAVKDFSDGFGVDAVVIAAATSSNDPIELAGEICRDRGRVSMVGAVRMDVPRTSFYGKELELRLSRSYGPGRYDPEYEQKGRDYPIGYVRWTERRNMQEFLRLVARGDVTPSRLTTHRVPIDRAADAYEVITGATGETFLGVLLTYPDAPAPRVTRMELRAPRAPAGRAGIGFIGAGSFGKDVLLPRFRASEGAELVGIATATGLSARTTGDKFGFRYCTTDAQQLLVDTEIHGVVVATRHASHPHFTAQALRAGKAVFVEKPLAIDEAGLQQVLEAQAETGGLIAVGFNRRFSPLAERLRAEFAAAGPIAIQYRVNAGPIPGEHWIHDPEDGGGRIVGEVCHFLDFAQFLTGDEPVEVFAQALGGPAGATRDTLSIVLRFAGGSVASINYFATGDKSVPKEHVEVYGGGAVGILDDFRRLTIARGGKRQEWKPRTQEKGFDQEIAAFVAALRGGPAPIPLESLVLTTRASFAVEEALRAGAPVRV